MKIHGLQEILREHPFFQDIKPSYLDLISGCAENVTYPKGGFLFRERGAADSFFVIRAGQIVLEVDSPKSGPIPVQTLHEGDVFGWAAIFPPYEWQFDALVQTSVRAIRMDAKCLRAKCEKDPGLGYDLMKRFAGVMLSTLRATRLQLVDAIEEAIEYHA